MAGDGSDSAGLMFAPWVIRESEAQDRYGRIDLEQPPPKGARPAIGAPSLVVRKLETSTSHFCQGTSFIAVSWSCDGWRRHAFKLSQPSPSPSLWGFWQRIAACYQRPGLGGRSGRVDLAILSLPNPTGRWREKRDLKSCRPANPPPPTTRPNSSASRRWPANLAATRTKKPSTGRLANWSRLPQSNMCRRSRRTQGGRLAPVVGRFEGVPITDRRCADR